VAGSIEEAYNVALTTRAPARQAALSVSACLRVRHQAKVSSIVFACSRLFFHMLASSTASSVSLSVVPRSQLLNACGHQAGLDQVR
jgi:hypothetical protein